jgi:hypothetical protein
MWPRLGDCSWRYRPLTPTSAIYHRSGQHAVRPAHPETPAGSPCAGARPGLSATSGRGHKARWSSRAIERAERSASPGLSPTAIAMIDAAQSGRLSMARCPDHTDRSHLSHDLVTGLLTGGRHCGLKSEAALGGVCRGPSHLGASHSSRPRMPRFGRPVAKIGFGTAPKALTVVRLFAE